VSLRSLRRGNSKGPETLPAPKLDASWRELHNAYTSEVARAEKTQVRGHALCRALSLSTAGDGAVPQVCSVHAK
jgi:hypothetical protein